MSDPESRRDFPDQSQRAAFCNSRFERMSAQVHNIRTQRAAGGLVRTETHEGRPHMVVPVVMIREGVLNGALLLAEEFGRFPESWDGRPVPVLHPKQQGDYVSANSPRVAEQTIGRVYNTHAEGDKLKAELWIDINKAEKLGHGELLRIFRAGVRPMEVSTAYFSDSEEARGSHRGARYTAIHRNLRPDHLALLPGEVGACSVADGCGAPRVNRGGLRVKVNEAMNVLRQALGLRTQCAGGCTGECNCNGGDMPDKQTLVQRAEKLHANEKLTPEQMEMLQNLAEDDQQLTMAKAFLDAVEKGAGGGEPDPDEMAEDEEYMAALAANSTFVQKLVAQAAGGQKGGDGKGGKPKVNSEGQPVTMTQDQINELVANEVNEQMRRNTVTQKLAANSECPFTEEEMADMPVTHLEKLEKSIRPADYSGQGGFASNGADYDEQAAPLTVHKGVLAPRDDKKE